MVKIQVSEIRDNLAEFLNRTAYGNERLVIERRGKAVAALVSMDDMELLLKLEAEVDLADARKALAEAEEEGTVSWKSLKQELSG